MNAIVGFALRQRVLIVVLLVLVLGAGITNFLALNIEAYPDPVPPLVDIVTQSTGQSAEEIERYITIPLEIQMAGIPNVQAIRTISLFGLSDVKVQFTYDFTYYQAEQWVTNRLSQLGSSPKRRPAADFADQPDRRDIPLSGGWTAQLFGDGLEDAGGLGAGRRFKAVPGVIDVTGWEARPRRTTSPSMSTSCWATGSLCRRCCRRCRTQHQRGRPDHRLRCAIRRGAGRGADPLGR